MLLRPLSCHCDVVCLCAAYLKNFVQGAVQIMANRFKLDSLHGKRDRTQMALKGYLLYECTHVSGAPDRLTQGRR